MKENISFLLRVLSFENQKHFKLKLVIILSLVILGGLLEFINFSFIIPILSKLSNSLDVESDYRDIFFLEYLFQLDIFMLLFLTILSVLVKNTIQFLGIYILNLFSHTIEASISKILFLSDLNLSLESIKSKNTSKSINNTISIAFNINRYFVLPVMSIIADSLILISMLAFLLLISPEITLMSIILFGFFQFFYTKIMGKKFNSWGQIKIESDEERLKIIQESLGSIIDVKINNKESFFLNKYNSPNQKSCDTGVYQNSFNQLPRFYFEILMYLFLLLTVYINDQYFGSNKNTLVLLGIFAASLIKVLPLLNKLMSSYHSISYSNFSLELLKKTNFTRLRESNKKRSLTFQEKVELKNVSFYYNEDKKYILKDFNLEIIKGQSYALLGDSGSGKSTLLNVILGLLNPIEGEILCDGKSIHDDIEAWHKNIGYVPQEIFLIDDTIKNNILFGLDDSEIDKVKLWKVIKLSQLDDFISSEKDLELNIGERGMKISGGQKQRIGIARVLYQDPDIIVFDESTSSLDEENEKRIFNTIQSLAVEKTIIVISHNQGAVNFCQNKIKILKLGYDE